MVGSISTFSGLEISGVSPRRVGNTHSFTCPKCGNQSVANRHYSHCFNRSCQLYVASGLDMVAASRTGGDYKEAVSLINQVSPTLRFTTDHRYHARKRRVFNWWLGIQSKDHTPIKLALRQWLGTKGLLVDHQEFGVTILDHKDIVELRKLASDTEGVVDDSMFNHKGAFIAYAVQTKPNQIDRIVVQNKKATEYSVTWNNLDRGVISLADMTPDSGALIYGDLHQMMHGKRETLRAGNHCRAAAYWIHKSRYRIPNPEPIVTPEGVNQLVGIIRKRSDTIRFTDMYEHLQHPDGFRAATKQITTGNQKGEKPRSWSSMRVSVALAALKDDNVYPGHQATVLLENLSLSRDEGSSLVAKLRNRSKLDLAENIYNYLNNTVIFSSSKVVVKSSTNDYQVTKEGATSQIANFCLELKDRVYLRETTQTYFSANLIFDKHSVPITISKEGLEDPKQMEKELQMIYVGKLETLHQDAGKDKFFPVISDVQNMRKYVIPYLKMSTSRLPSVPGVDRLGWSQNNTLFVAPGMLLDMDNRVAVKSKYMPKTEVFKFMDSQSDWDATKVDELPCIARDLVGMILANVVRSYLGVPNKPIAVRSNNTTRMLLKGMFRALGQHTIFSLENDMSYQRGVDGIRGFPLLCNNYGDAQINASTFSHVVLGDGGYTTKESVTDEQIYAAGRTLQYALSRVVEWCLAEGADGFSQARGFTNTSILLKEGKWLMEKVCAQQPWEVSNMGLADLEALMQQIDYDDVPEVMELHEGETLVIKTKGLVLDTERVAFDLQELNINHNMGEDSIRMVASRSMPVLREFYGKTPKPKSVLKTV